MLVTTSSSTLVWSTFYSEGLTLEIFEFEPGKINASVHTKILLYRIQQWQFLHNLLI